VIKIRYFAPQGAGVSGSVHAQLGFLYLLPLLALDTAPSLVRTDT